MAKTVILSCRDMEIPVNMIRSNRKTYGLTINDRAEVSLRIPLRGSEREALSFAKEKSDWIYEKYQKQMQKLQRQKELRSENNLSEEQRKGLERRYRLAAKEYFPKRAAYYAGQLGVDYKKIRIGGQKTCFGSCSSSGTLSFNWRLMLAPPKVLDYVVVHELCHCRHMNHSKEFWAEVERIMPDYKEYRKWLKENGDTLQV